MTRMLRFEIIVLNQLWTYAFIMRHLFMQLCIDHVVDLVNIHGLWITKV